MTAVIRTSDLTRSFRGETAVDGLTFEAEEGEVVALLGPNGAGKTTTIRLLNGVLVPDRGRAEVLGLDPVTDGTELRRHTGVLTESAGLDDRLTARENVALLARIRGIPAAEAGRRAGDLLERLHMARWADTAVRTFSTGQRKRVGLAVALLHDPEVLFLDEPTSGLDPAATREVLDLIASLAAERRRTVVLCTHFLGDAGRLCRRMAVLERGRLQAFGSPEELAARFWEGLVVDVDLGRPADERLRAAVAAHPPVLSAASTPDGLRVRVRGRADVPGLVAVLVGREVPVYGAVPRPPTLEDVYFAVQDRAQVAEPLP